MVEAQHPAEPLAAFDSPRCSLGVLCRLDQPIIEPLMVPLPVMVSGLEFQGFWFG